MTLLHDIRPEFPSQDAISAYGALSFLYMHSSRHLDWPLRDIRRIVQPPIDLKQARIFYYDGVPRAACTWAHLNGEAERQFLAGAPLRPAQWRSGPRLWLMEIVAPYEQGTGANAFRAFIEHIPEGIKSFRYLRVSGAGEVRRVVESTRLRDRSWGAKILTTALERT
ncbi:toxin-activating lysine-acyltransferase [Paracoccus sp. TOH]|uniref:toxin-activating lysine-acyltransferase n=1 Tax=Paracoccus sp. TOH TaxID=1263728 RepID=UPI0025B17E17|nr:toxin-activating lysine-acyltransferase [Paracoccus sp. TOH]WJS85371.1 toxin-activating lysine-acyltransferase [Paracoccus sp. TOH]